MSDDKSKPVGHDRTRISLSDEYDVHDWADKFSVTREELVSAVNQFANEASAVEADLKSSKSRAPFGRLER